MGRIVECSALRSWQGLGNNQSQRSDSQVRAPATFSLPSLGAHFLSIFRVFSTSGSSDNSITAPVLMHKCCYKEPRLDRDHQCGANAFGCSNILHSDFSRCNIKQHSFSLCVYFVYREAIQAINGCIGWVSTFVARRNSKLRSRPRLSRFFSSNCSLQPPCTIS